MANNFLATVTGAVPATETVVITSIPLVRFKSIKWIVTVEDLTAGKTRGFEAAATYSISLPVTPVIDIYSEIGDAISYTFDLAYNATDEAIDVSVTNNDVNELNVYIAEVERIE